MRQPLVRVQPGHEGGVCGAGSVQPGHQVWRQRRLWPCYGQSYQPFILEMICSFLNKFNTVLK